MSKVKKEKNERYYYKLYRGIFGWLVRLVLPTRIFGEEITDGGKFIVSNHLSLLDPAITFAYIPGYKRFISKIELEKKFFIGKVFSQMGAVFLNRQAEGGDLSSIKKILKASRNGEQIALFPEGTRNRTGSTDMMQIKDGISLFVLKGTPIVLPVMMLNKPKIFKKSYVYIGNHLDLSEYKGLKPDAELIEKVRQLIQSHMEDAKEKGEKFLNSVGDKGLKKLYKQQKKENRKNKEKSYLIKVENL